MNYPLLFSDEIPVEKAQPKTLFKKICLYLGIGVKKDKKERIWEIDFIRGFCIILMLFDHFMFDVGFVFAKAWIATGTENLIDFVNFARWYWNWDLRLVVHDIVLVCFFGICGISCSFSRSNLKRAIVIGFCAGMISLVTYFLNIFISFGVLHMLSIAVFIYYLVTVIFKSRDSRIVVSMILSFTVFMLDIYLNNATLNNTANLFFIHENLITGSLQSADYFPLIPYTALVFLGAGLGPLIYKTKTSKMKNSLVKKITCPVTFAGKYVIFFYITHQIIISGILALISYCCLTPGNFVII